MTKYKLDSLLEFTEIESDPQFHYLQVNGLGGRKGADVKRPACHTVAYASAVSDVMGIPLALNKGALAN